MQPTLFAPSRSVTVPASARTPDLTAAAYLRRVAEVQSELEGLAARLSPKEAWGAFDAMPPAVFDDPTSVVRAARSLVLRRVTSDL